jgi:2-hydroxychromene-2-carboxylate isomerase
MVPSVDLYLDYACPSSYLALIRLRETALRTGAQIFFRPVMLDDVLDHLEPPLPYEPSEHHPARQRYQTKDLHDWAHYCGVTLNRPVDWPAPTGAAARAALAADRQGRCAGFSLALYQAYFGAGEDIRDPDVLARAADRAGLNQQAFADALAGPGLPEGLARNRMELLQRDGFGTPTMFVGEQIFFGHDRIPLVEFAIGQASNRRFVAPGDHSA